MTATIYVILGIVLIVIGIIVLLPLLLKKRASSMASLTAIIDISPTGETQIEITPSSSITDIRLIKLALLYAAKIRYLQNSEPPELIEMYRNLIEGLTESSFGKSNFVENLSDMVKTLQNQDEALATVEKGERFTIRLIEGKTNHFVHNDLPLPGLAANLPISVLLLMHDVIMRLDKQNIPIFERALKL